MTDAVREYRQWCEAEYEKHAAVTQRKADAALAEAYAVIERQARMLRRIDAIVFDVPKTGDPDSAVMDIARVFSDADLARYDADRGEA